MRLWLDDLRAPPEGWTQAKSVGEAKALMEKGDVENASLDHDLGCTSDCAACKAGLEPNEGQHQLAPTGRQFVLWMIENNKWPTHKPHVHSANPYGAMSMNSLIDRYGPYKESK